MKDSDKVQFNLHLKKSEPKKDDVSNIDEISSFLEARYVSAAESCWRIFGFPNHSQYPATIRLPVHLENQHLITFKETDDLNTIVSKNENTHLTHYFKLNQTNIDVQNLFYFEMPEFFD